MSRSRVEWYNLSAAVAAITAAIIAATVGHEDASVVARASGDDPTSGAEFVELADGRPALLDADGTPVPLTDYRSIASGSTVSDWLLFELCEPERIRAVTERSLKSAPWRHRFVGKRALASLNNVEALLALKPDLLIIDSFGDPSRVARLRERGITVYDMGQMRGLTTLWPTIERIGALCGRHARARALTDRWRRAMTALAAGVPVNERARGLYLSPYGDKLFGGTKGTGYHDLLHHGGLRDAAAATFSDFPEYNAEQVLGLDPDLIITREGMAGAVCRHAGLSVLRACRQSGAIIELPSFAIDDPGLGLLESIESLYRAVYDRPQSSSNSSSAPAGESRE